MIPHILHQTWKSRSLPERFVEFRETWKQHNPGWELRFYDDADCEAIVGREFPDLLPVYRAFPKAIQRADFFRYLIVYLHGGVYADMDMECRQSHADLIAGTDLVLGVEETVSVLELKEAKYKHRLKIANCIFAASPGNPFLRLLIDQIAETFRAGGAIEEVIDLTGPGMMTYMAHRHCRDLDCRILPQMCWVPPTLPAYPDCFPFNRHIFAVHHFAGTWKSGSKNRLPLGPLVRGEWEELKRVCRLASSPLEVISHAFTKLPPSPVWWSDFAFWRRGSRRFKSLRL